MDRQQLEQIVRREGGRLLATLVRRFGDLQLAEDAVQDAVIKAIDAWPRTGVPNNPGAWLTTAAKNSVLDRVRRESKRTDKEETAVGLSLAAANGLDGRDDDWDGRDDRLRLVFTCCHPALNQDAQVALALRTLCGLTPPEIAAAYLTTTTTMQQRIVRAKKKIASAKIPYRIPSDAELPERVTAVLAVIYLLFTQGHHATAPADDTDVVRTDLAEEAIFLARLVRELLPTSAEAAGLLSLMLATHARRDARVDADGELILMADQDRSRWDSEAIREGFETLQAAMAMTTPGPYQIQAAIACLHGVAPTAADTDWRQIAELYEALERFTPTAVVRINRAVALAEVEGPGAGLTLVDATSGLEGWHFFHAIRADFLRRLRRANEAADAYRAALECEPPAADRRFLERRLAAVDG